MCCSYVLTSQCKFNVSKYLLLIISLLSLLIVITQMIFFCNALYYTI